MSRGPETPTRVAVVGATGNSGSVASHLVEHHPGMTLAAVTSERWPAGTWLRSVCPGNELATPLEPFDADRIAARADAAVVGYPHGKSAPAVAELRARGVKVVELAGDNRLSPEGYARYYGGKVIPELLDEAVYGLTELHRDEIRDAELVANPGCYATAAILALAPLREHLAEVAVDGKSGISGAGRGADVEEDAKGYRPFGHAHLGELERELKEGTEIRFVPHLVPEYQGLLVTCHARLKTGLTQAEVDELYRAAYESEPFVHVQTDPPGINEVRATNRCHVSVHVDPETGHVVAFGAIDNLWKGAAGQAIQNLNVMTGRPETAGLVPPAARE